MFACLNDCMLYYKDDKRKKEDSVWGQPRLKPDMEDNTKQSHVPYKVLQYFSLTPRLQRLYMLSKTARNMR